MLNLTLDQKLNCRRLSAFRNVHHKKGSTNFGTHSCVNRLHQKKIQIQQRNDTNWQLSSPGVSKLWPAGQIQPSKSFVELALHPQHEASLDSGIKLSEVFNYFKNKSRNRPRSLSMVSLNSSDWEEYWNTKVLPRNALNSKRMKLEKSND